MMKSRFLFSLAILVILVLSSCSTAAPSAAPTLPPTATIPAVPSITVTLPPTATSAPTITPLPTMTFTPTVTVTQGAEFGAATIKSIGPHKMGMMLTLEVPGLNHLYKLKILDKLYTCSAVAQYPDRMYCYGPLFETGQYQEIAFLEPDSDVEAFRGSFLVPNLNSPTSMPAGDPRTWCPERGQNVTCEVECRIGPNGPCIVATCFDACGYYYSVHTCPDDMVIPSPMCSPEDQARLDPSP